MATARKKHLSLFDDALRAHHKVRFLIGVDEAGRGPLAGPVVAASVLLGSDPLPELKGVRDSKAINAAKRDVLFETIRKSALSIGVGWATSEEIDRHNILQATFLAMRRAMDQVLRRSSKKSSPIKFDLQSTLIVVDGNKTIPGVSHQQKALVKGDKFSLAIASASIVAKVVRDRWMNRLDRVYPGYGFSAHKGYGTADHVAALTRLGPSPTHRRSFEPVAQIKLL